MEDLITTMNNCTHNRSTLTDPESRTELLDFFKSWTWNNPLSATLTCRNGRLWESGYFSSAKLQDVQKNLRHVLNRVNNDKSVFGNRGKRKKKRLQSVAVTERNQSGRYHFHLQIDIPVGLSAELIVATLKREWAKSDWGFNETDIKPVRDEGWLDYMLKPDSKPEYDLYIDWINCSRAKT